MTVRLSAPASIALVLALLAAPVAAQENDSSPGLSGAPGSAAAQTSLADIEDEVMCPICGTTLALSQAPQAERQRVFIQRLIAEGRSKDEIKDALVAEFGPEVLAVPDSEGFDLFAWLVPGLGILLAAAAIGIGLGRWRRTRAAGAGGDTEALDDAERERLDSDLARYDL